MSMLKNQAKLEAIFSMGIGFIIGNFLLRGIEMPLWAMYVLIILIVSYFTIRLFVIFEFIIQHKVTIKPTVDEPPKWLLDLEKLMRVLTEKKNPAVV